MHKVPLQKQQNKKKSWGGSTYAHKSFFRTEMWVLFSVPKKVETILHGRTRTKLRLSMETPFKISIVRIIPKVTNPLGLIIPSSFVGSR